MEKKSLSLSSNPGGKYVSAWSGDRLRPRRRYSTSTDLYKRLETRLPVLDAVRRRVGPPWNPTVERHAIGAKQVAGRRGESRSRRRRYSVVRPSFGHDLLLKRRHRFRQRESSNVGGNLKKPEVIRKECLRIVRDNRCRQEALDRYLSTVAQSARCIYGAELFKQLP